MKDVMLFPLLNPRFKFIGLLISFSSLSGLIFQKFTGKSFDSFLSADQQSQLLFLLISMGLFLCAFSKEYLDNDRIKVIRGKSIQAGFGLLISIIITFSFVSIINPHPTTNNQNDLSLMVMIGIMFYLIIFNFGIYFDPKWIYTEDSISKNLQKNRLYFFVYLAVTALGFLLLIL